jgi:hypothetical protein
MLLVPQLPLGDPGFHSQPQMNGRPAQQVHPVSLRAAKCAGMWDCGLWEVPLASDLRTRCCLGRRGSQGSASSRVGIGTGGLQLC